MSELMIIIQGLPYAEVEAWNIARNLMLCSMAPYMKQKMRPDEFLPLVIDESYQEKQSLTTEISNEDIKWFKEYVKNYKKEG